jgi:hypothetical protein
VATVAARVGGSAPAGPLAMSSVASMVPRVPYASRRRRRIVALQFGVLIKKLGVLRVWSSRVFTAIATSFRQPRRLREGTEFAQVSTESHGRPCEIRRVAAQTFPPEFLPAILPATAGPDRIAADGRWMHDR